MLRRKTESTRLPVLLWVHFYKLDDHIHLKPKINKLFPSTAHLVVHLPPKSLLHKNLPGLALVGSSVGYSIIPIHQGCRFNPQSGHIVEATNECIKKWNNMPWLVWLNGLSTGPQTKGSPIQFPIRARAWVVSQVPSRGHMRGNHTLMFLSLFLPPFPCLKIKKKKSLKKISGITNQRACRSLALSNQFFKKEKKTCHGLGSNSQTEYRHTP